MIRSAAMLILAVAATVVLLDTELPRPQAQVFAAAEYGTDPAGTVYLEVRPGRRGNNMVHLHVTDARHAMYDPRAIRVVLVPVGGAAPLEVPLVRAETGMYEAHQVVVPHGGQWTTQVTLSAGPGKEVQVSLPIVVSQ